MIWLVLLFTFITSLRVMFKGLRQCNVEGCLLGVSSMIVGYYFYGPLGAIASPFVLVAALSIIGAIFFS